MATTVLQRSARPVAADFTLLRCRISGVAAVAANSRHAFGRHTHEQFGIGVMDRGAQISASGRGQIEAVEGDLITVNPGEVHDGAPLGDAARSWRMLYFDSAMIVSAWDRGGGRASCEFIRPAAQDPTATCLFDRLFQLATGPTLEVEPLQQDELVSALLMRLAEAPRRLRGTAAIPAIGRALELIDDDLAARLTLDDLACAAGLGRFQCLRAFARATGFTPHAYILQRRADLAKRLIAKRAGLAEASVAAGFSDQSHMTRVFVRKYGLTPGAFSREAAIASKTPAAA